jgi:hypothetical protein
MNVSENVAREEEKLVPWPEGNPAERELFHAGLKRRHGRVEVLRIVGESFQEAVLLRDGKEREDDCQKPNIIRRSNLADERKSEQGETRHVRDSTADRV